MSQASAKDRAQAARRQAAPSAAHTLFLLGWIAFLSSAFLLAKHLHERLPTPLTVDHDQQTGRAVISERWSREVTSRLAEEYRLVGMKEAVDAELYIIDIIREFQKQLQASEFSNLHNLEVSYQNGTSAHLFDFIGKPVHKAYYGISNVVARISSKKRPTSTENALLINAHIDSTFSSPGAADDAAACSVMLDVLRVLLDNEQELYHSVIFLFNGAEESLQDGSHLFITEHPWKDTVRAVINLEAVGTKGKEIVFQATSEEMLRAYSHVPHPYGTVLANEVFSTGIFVSDTDFRQFELYSPNNLTGLDIAWVKNSYLYHTDADRIENLGHGSLQNMGENVLELVRQMTSKDAKLFDFQRSTSSVYFSIFGGLYFVLLSTKQVMATYVQLLTVAVALAVPAILRRPGNFILAFISTPLSLVGAILGANTCALIMTRVFNKALSWYSNELYCAMLYGPPAFLGAVSTQMFLRRFFKSENNEHLLLSSQALHYTFLAFLGQSFGIGSSYMFGIVGCSLTVGLLYNLAVAKSGTVHLSTYFVGSLFTMLIGSEGLISFLDLFVVGSFSFKGFISKYVKPMGGRMGPAPADHIIASIVALLAFQSLPMLVTLVHRDAKLTRTLFFRLASLSVIVMLFFFRQAPFDKLHPRRAIVFHTENITTTPSTFSIDFATVDSAPGYSKMVSDVVAGLNLPIPAQAVNARLMNDQIPDWDVVYPVSQFLTSYKIPVEAGIASPPWRETFHIRAIASTTNAVKQTRQVTLEISHPGLYAVVLAFNAHVLSWSLPVKADDFSRRHHVKSVTGYGRDRWTLDLNLKLTSEEFQAALRYSQRAKGQRPVDEVEDGPGLGQLKIDFSAIEDRAHYHARKTKYTGGSEAMDTFKKIDALLPDYIDSAMFGIIAGVAYV